MPRSLDVAVPAEATDALSARLLEEDGVLSLQVTKGSSLKPPGDVLSLLVLDRSLPSVMQVLLDRGVGRDDAISLTSHSPLSVVSPTSTPVALRDNNESTLEEMEQILGREAHPTVTVLSLMAISGVLATVGIAQSALHVVIAAMIIAPGFLPIVRAAFGAIARRGDVAAGVIHTAQAYAALLLGAAVTALVLSATGRSPLGLDPAYEPPLVSVAYWTTVSFEAVIVTLVAGIAGALVIATNRAILTAGVMVALSLVPAAALVPAAVLAGDLSLAGNAAIRWLVDVALLSAAAAAVLLIKQRVIHRGRTLP